MASSRTIHPKPVSAPSTINPEDTDSYTYGYRLMWQIRVVGDYEADVRTVARGYLFVYQDVAVTSA